MTHSKSLRRNRKAASPAVSMVIITAATVVLVLVSGSYALQVLMRQQGANEYDTVKKSLLTFDDAFRDIAFDRGGSRSVRFTTQYGYMELIPEYEILTIGVAEFPGLKFDEIQTGAIKYHIPTSYVTYGDGYYSYVLGDENVSVTSATDSIGRLLESQAADLTLNLDYRVRVTKEGPSTSIGGESVNYVDILVVRMNITKSLNLFGDFDVTARNLAVTTQYVLVDDGPVASSTYHVNVMMGSKTTTIPIALDSGRLVFNLIIADIKVSN
jgi:hypothetical protein